MRFPSLSALAFGALVTPLLSAQPAVQAPAKPYYLHDGDTVVFYGDSITEQRFYTQLVETYTATRFPHMPVQFFTAGVGGDRVTGGSGGPIDLRLSRDVFPLKPSVVTIMLGMNDGGYHPLDAPTEQAYTTGYEHILTSIEQNAPGARITLLGPSPYDDITRPPFGYNATLTRFGAIDAGLAAKHKATYIDLNAPFNEALRRGSALMPTATQLLIPDRVHPAQLAHWFMADALLKGWNAPEVVSSATIDAGEGMVDKEQNTKVWDITGDGTTIHWTALDEALPLPIQPDHPDYDFLLQLCDIVTDLDQQPLIVRRLEPGSYELTIDGKHVGEFTAEEFAAGVNLALLDTPMRSQAFEVSWIIRDREEAHYVRLRMLISQMKTGVSRDKGVAELSDFEAAEQKAIYEAAQPKPHQFTIKPAGPAAHR